MPGRYTVGHDEIQVLKSLSEALYVIDTDGRIQFCNAALAELTGYPADVLLGRPSLDLYAPEDRPTVLDRRTRAFQGEPVPRLLEATLLRHDGARLPIELSLTSLRREGRVVGRVARRRGSWRRLPARDTMSGRTGTSERTAPASGRVSSSPPYTTRMASSRGLPR